MPNVLLNTSSRPVNLVVAGGNANVSDGGGMPHVILSMTYKHDSSVYYIIC